MLKQVKESLLDKTEELERVYIKIILEKRRT